MGMVKALIRKFWRPLLAIWATCALGIAVMIGLSGGCLSLEKSTEDYLKDYRYYDASITTEVTADDMESVLASVEGVKHVDARMVANSVMVGPSERYLSIRAMTYAPDDRQRFVVWKSASTNGREAVMVEYDFALENGIEAGDEVEIRVGDSYRTYVVEGLVTAPETLSVRALDNVSARNSDFGYVYVPISLVEHEPNHEYEDARAELDQHESEYDEARAEARQTYDQALDEMQKAQSELDARLQEARTAIASLSVMRATLDAQQQTALDGLAQIDQKEKELVQTREQLQSLYSQLLDALRQANDALLTLNDRRSQVSLALDQLLSTKAELERITGLLEEAQNALRSVDEQIAQARQLKDLIASEQVQLMVSLLRQMDPNRELPTIAKLFELLGEFRDLCAKYGIDLDASGTPHQVAEALIGVMDTIESDNKTLNDPSSLDLVKRIDDGDEAARESEEGKALAHIVERYTNEPLSMSSFQSAVSRCQQLQDFIVNNKLRQFAQELSKLTEEEYKDWIEVFTVFQTYLDKLKTFMGGEFAEIKTVGQLLELFDQLPDRIDAAIAGLYDARGQIVDQLAEAGVAEEDLDGVLDQLRASTDEATQALVQAQDGLVAIDDALVQTRSGIETLNSNIDQAQNGLEQVEGGMQQLTELRQEANDALRLIDEGRTELNAAQAQAQAGLGTIDSLQGQLNSKRGSVEDQWLQGLVEFSNLRDELDRAREKLGVWQGYQVYHNQFLLWFEEGADPKATLEAACAAISPLKVKSSFTYEDSPVKNKLDNNVKPLRALSYFMPSVFFVVVLIVAFLFMSLIVRQSRTNIGILRALGKSTGEVRAIFCLVGLVVTLCAIPLGIGVGQALVRYTASYFSDFFKLPEFECRFDNVMLALSLILTVVVVQLSTLVGTSMVSSVQPSEAISRTVPPMTEVPHVVELFTQNLDELSKFSVVSFLRNPLRLGFSVLCIAASAAIIFAAQSFIASKNQLVKQEFDQRVLYDCQIFLADDPDQELFDQLNGLGFVSDLQRMGFYSTTISFGDKQEDATVNAVEPNTNLIGIFDAHGYTLKVPQQGIILDDNIAQKLGVGVGNTVTVNGVSLRVEALSRQDSSRVQYVSLDTAATLGKGSLGCVICRVNTEDQQRLVQTLSERNDYVFALFTDVLRTSTEKLHATYDLSAWILTCFAVTIGGLVVLNVMQTNMLERKRELCVLRTLGFYHEDLSRALFSQTILYAVLACLLGLPTGKLIALQALMRIETPGRSFPYANGLREYAITILIVFVYATVSHFIAMHDMRKWDINEAVRDKE